MAPRSLRTSGAISSTAAASVIAVASVLAVASPLHASRVVSVGIASHTVATFLSNTSASSVSITLPIAVTAGDALVVTVMVVSPASPTSLQVRDGHNTYTADADVANRSVTNRVVVLSAMNVKALPAGTKLTVRNLPSSKGQRVAVNEFAGLLAVDQHVGTYHRNTAAGPFSSGTSGTTGQAAEFLFAAVGAADSTAAPVWDAGWAGLQTVSANSDPLSAAGQQVSSTGKFSASGTATGRWVAELVTFTLVAPGPSPTPTPTSTPTATPTATPTPTPTPPSGPSSPCTASTCRTCDVTTAPYNADNTGMRDATLAIRQAISDCQSSQGTPVPNVVWFPAGTYALNLFDNTIVRNDLVVSGPFPVIIAGQGRAGDQYSTTLVEHVGVLNPLDCSYALGSSTLSGGGCLNNERTCVPYTDPRLNTCLLKNIISIQAGGSGSTVQNIALDTRQYDAGTALGVSADHVTISHVSTAHKSAEGPDVPHFPVLFSGNGASRSTPCATNRTYCHWGNVINDLVAYDEECDDGIVFAMQGNAVINKLQMQGSRLALYVDSNVHVNGFNYTPGVEVCKSQTGFAETSPADHIYINDYVDHNTGHPGGGGAVGNSESGYSYMTDVLAISGYVIEGANADQLGVKNVNGFSLGRSSTTPCDFGANNKLNLAAGATVSGVTVRDCVLSETVVSLPAGVSIVGGVTYINDTFTQQASQSYSFTDPSHAAVAIAWSGGAFQNCPDSGKYLTNSLNLTIQTPVDLKSPSGYPC